MQCTKTARSRLIRQNNPTGYREKRGKRKAERGGGLWLAAAAVGVLAVFAWLKLSPKLVAQQLDGGQGIENWQVRAREIKTDNLHSPNIILVRLKDGKIILEERSQEKIYPASLTKIMTALVAIENLDDLEKKVELTEDIFEDLYEQNASMAGFLPDEKVRAKDLLYGALLPSGAESSLGLAVEVSGSEKEFVKLMNQKARKLGMTGTNFTNVAGFDDPKHYTTVADMAILLEEALKNKTFREIFTASRHSTKTTNRHDGGITFESTLFKKLDDATFKGGEILGGKTGYTSGAGLCLASLAEKNGEEYILVTAGALGNSQTEQYNITDAMQIYSEI